MTIDKDQILKTYFTTQQPLGDIAALENLSDDSRLVYNTYFDRDNFPIRELRRNPTMIVGRKGSGKTDALLSYRFDTKAKTDSTFPVVYFEAGDVAKAITTVINQIDDAVRSNYPPPTVEEVSHFWTTLFWICIYHHISNNDIDKRSTEFVVLSQFCK